MAKEYPVGKAQKMVLDALGEQAESFQEAESIFANKGIVVTAVRVGRTSEPRVSVKQYEDEYGDSKLRVLAHWMSESDARFVTPTKEV